ncbi:DHS-like NAD/FAD-binding domain-containing protein, partial [Pluteus cervinus]
MGVTLDLQEALSQDSTVRNQLRDVAHALARSRRVLIVTGAGISCGSGIPDFRTPGGLFDKAKKRFGIDGRDLFSTIIFKRYGGVEAFNKLMGELKETVYHAQPTRTHHFIKRLDSLRVLLRCYTQNIDGLEELAGIPESLVATSGCTYRDGKSVQLHGTIRKLRCISCAAQCDWTEDYVESFKSGVAPDCPACKNEDQLRNRQGRRSATIGRLRPAIILYEEVHPLGDDIADLQNYDKQCQPDFLIVMGTSLKIAALVDVVKIFADGLGENAIFVNKEPVNATLNKIFGYHIQGDAGAWVDLVLEDWEQ